MQLSGWPALALLVLLAQSSAVSGFEPAAPWTAPPGTVFPYTNLENSLDALLQVQASPHRWITMVRMARPALLSQSGSGSCNTMHGGCTAATSHQACVRLCCR